MIDTNMLVTHVHRQLGAEGYGAIVEAGPEEEISAARVPAITMSLSGLGLRPL